MSASYLFGQIRPNNDSLKRLLSKSHGEHRIEILLQLSDQTRRSDIEIAIEYAREAVNVAEKLDKESLLGESYRTLGWLFSIDGDYPRGLQNLVQARQVFERIADSHKVAATLENLGALYRRQSNYSTALEYYYRALELKEPIQEQADLAHTLLNIGVINEKLGQKKKAIDFYKRALAISQQNEDASNIAINAVQLGKAHASAGKIDQALKVMGMALDASKQLPGEHATATVLLEVSELYEDQKAYRRAIDANREALNLAREMSDRRLEGLALKNIALIYTKQGDLTQANRYLVQTLPLFEQSGIPEEIIHIQIQLAHNYFAQGKAAESIVTGKTALQKAEELGSFELSRQVLEALIKMYHETNKFDEAFWAQKQLIAVKDSIYNQVKSGKIAEIQTLYETKQKEQEIALLQKQKEQQALLRNALMAGLILIGLIGILVYNRQRLKIKKNSTELENTRLKEQKLVQDLEFKNRQLTTHTLHLVQKNETMKELKDKIGRIRRDNGNIGQGLQKLENLVDYSFNLDDDWEQFRLAFEEVHKGFFDYLKKCYPDLTPNELRLAALAKLNLSIKETATLMGITPNSVKTARYRLRKKLDIKTEENLAEFMMAIDKVETK